MRGLILLLTVPVLLLGVGCGGGEGSSRGTQGGPTTEVDAQAGEGQALFEANCAGCHGQDLRGTDSGPPFLHPVYAPDHHSDEAFFAAVERGAQQHHWEYGPMPPIPGLSNSEVAAIVGYTRGVQETEGLGD
jgi:mono/diheme cytochrome c family protein